MRKSLLIACGLVASLSVLAACRGDRGSSSATTAPAPTSVAQASYTGGSQMLSANGRQMQLLSGGAGPRSTVIILHGGLSSVSKMQAKAPIGSELAARGINAVYLYGTPQFRVGDRATWNAGSCCGSAMEQNVDDIGYISAAISTLVAQGIADPGRVYLAGHSNGGMMSYRYACTRPGSITGVIGMAAPFVASSCPSASGVRILHIQGRRDETVPIAGGGKGDRLMGSGFPSTEQTLSILRNAGASVEVLYLNSAEHQVDTINTSALRELGQSLGGIIGNFVN
ncbi:CE1 family esterase [Roseivivax sp. CAU 1753]